MKRVQPRGASQSKKPLQSTTLEAENREMEAKLRELKEILAKEAAKRDLPNDKVNSNSSRWRSATDKQPLKSYANFVLTNKPPAKVLAKGDTQRPNSSSKPPQGTQTLKLRTSSRPGTGEAAEQKKKPAEDEPTRMPTAESTERKTEEKLRLNSFVQITKETKEERVTRNIELALIGQRPDGGQVKSFLEGIGLGSYFERFMDYGFDDLELLLELKKEYLEEMNIPLGHQIKILKRTAELRDKGKKKSEAIGGKVEEQEQQADGIAIGTDDRESEDLRDGVYDEKKNHLAFLEALNEWREGKEKAKQEEAKPTKTVRFADNVEEEKQEKRERIAFRRNREGKVQEMQQEAPKSSFLFSGGGTWNAEESVMTGQDMFTETNME
eukprot:TRINITY_DN2622_c0_g1_i5.p1 TRINITY_DN2622_c0_g1~~TRINITY_DN2622_c0_g1_i5.p1  ORF type:complete len:382 (+),score=115.63 TRINITY_DN2622_c0_g1_i5:139-1284(+)